MTDVTTSVTRHPAKRVSHGAGVALAVYAFLGACSLVWTVFGSGPEPTGLMEFWVEAIGPISVPIAAVLAVVLVVIARPPSRGLTRAGAWAVAASGVALLGWASVVGWVIRELQKLS